MLYTTRLCYLERDGPARVQLVAERLRRRLVDLAQDLWLLKEQRRPVARLLDVPANITHTTHIVVFLSRRARSSSYLSTSLGVVRGGAKCVCEKKVSA